MYITSFTNENSLNFYLGCLRKGGNEGLFKEPIQGNKL